MKALTYTTNVFTAPEAWNLRAVRNLALFVLAPFIGLAYVVALPFVGLGMLAWIAVKK
jgi:hypothetical protein